MDDKMKPEQTNAVSLKEVKEEDIPFIDEDEEPGKGPSEPIAPPTKYMYMNMNFEIEFCIEYSSSSSEYSRDQFWDDYSTPSYGSYQSEEVYPYGEISPCPQLAEDETAIDMPPEEPEDEAASLGDARACAKICWWFILLIITVVLFWVLQY